MSTVYESRYVGELALSVAEEDVLRDLVGSTPGDDALTIPAYQNALHSLRMKVSLRFTEARGVDVSQAVGAVERLAEYANERDVPLRFYFNWDRSAYEVRVGDREWVSGQMLSDLIPRVASELFA